MKISTRIRYGLRALVYIAEQNRDFDRLVRIKEISKDQNISVQYLEQILFKLKKENIIEGKRGPNGGYKLIGDPKKINVFRLYEILDSDVKIVDCNENTENKSCVEEKCRTSCLWSRLDNALSDILKETTLDDLINNKEMM
ncbi:RrF2 family transcriptional regulator [Ilyobacter polytropus]|uniref:Transcriptional regulator, BadM/Rrf2 family n=1 Tax=Ilyobacter polytropus (strain ATCC 51220 / DSM 2926 / LMG 16218 / CuHBu1) TaxID=572544 RepID=E3HA92_ILYPC|nr:Rrf2 family transcriptional regulator [Ilyobacter polytropus]ADO83497.1 transcriptional regulator, BadM/Rrf2 family [Ilyobacter polytropus DSM 2926]